MISSLRPDKTLSKGLEILLNQEQACQFVQKNGVIILFFLPLLAIASFHSLSPLFLLPHTYFLDLTSHSAALSSTF